MLCFIFHHKWFKHFPTDLNLAVNLLGDHLRKCEIYLECLKMVVASLCWTIFKTWGNWVKKRPQKTSGKCRFASSSHTFSEAQCEWRSSPGMKSNQWGHLVLRLLWLMLFMNEWTNKWRRKNVPGPMMSTMGYLKQDILIKPVWISEVRYRKTCNHSFFGEWGILPCSLAFVFFVGGFYFVYACDCECVCVQYQESNPTCLLFLSYTLLLDFTFI